MTFKEKLEARGLIEGIDFTFSNPDDPKYRSCKYGVNPFIPKPEDRPRCSVKGCCNPRQIINVTKTGRPTYRKICVQHKDEGICKKHGVNSIDEVTAKNKGMTVKEYRHSIHPYLSNRLDYCENVDGRLGYVCKAHIPWEGILQVDHIDGNPHNHDPANLQTLCANCHTYKTHINKDYKTPGRKSKPTFDYAMKGLA